MSLPNPNPGIDPGPDYADNLFSCNVIIDQHDHTPGAGQQITPAGMNINVDLPFNNNDAVSLRSVRFQAQVSPLPASTPDLLCLYASGVDLYYNDGNGNQVRITQAGSVTGASGTITGLPSGTASASFVPATGTFVWEQATGLGANMDAATYILRYPGSYPTPSGDFIAIQAPSTLATGFAYTLPDNTPANPQSALVSDTSGNLSYMDPDDIANARTRTTGSTVAVGGVAISASCGSFSRNGALIDITNLSVTITTSGRPVYIGISQDGVNFTSNNFLAIPTSNVEMALLRNGSQIAQQSYNAGTAVSLQPSFNFLDVVVNGLPGTYTYKFQLGCLSATANFNNYVAFAYEL